VPRVRIRLAPPLSLRFDATPEFVHLPLQIISQGRRFHFIDAYSMTRTVNRVYFTVLRAHNFQHPLPAPCAATTPDR